jgi:hypothetical protein
MGQRGELRRDFKTVSMTDFSPKSKAGGSDCWPQVFGERKGSPGLRKEDELTRALSQQTR